MHVGNPLTDVGLAGQKRDILARYMKAKLNVQPVEYSPLQLLDVQHGGHADAHTL